MRAVVMWFDPSTEECLLSLWTALADLGVPALAPPGRPHVTMLLADEIDADIAVKTLSKLSMGWPAELGAVALFPPAVLHLSVTPTRDLLALQSSVLTQLGTAARGLDRFSAAPGHWSPHCTLAPDVPDALLAEAFQVARKLLPIRGTFEWLGVEEAGSYQRWPIPPATTRP
jgi:2'-5' RNA ligase